MLDPVGPTERPHLAPLATLGRTLDGRALLSAFRAATAGLEAHVEDLNRLNVYPVPDGDTGSNMLTTARAALAEAERVSGRRSPGAGRIASALADGALAGARGNSGVIVSQVLGGVADGLAGRRRVSGPDLARALDAGATRARVAVARPVDGTILTVVDAAAGAAADAARQGGDVETVLEAAVDAARIAVARTPRQLAVLRDAGVVDAGGHGLALILEGMLRDLRGAGSELPPRADASPRRLRLAVSRVSAAIPVADRIEDGYGFEVTFLVRARRGATLDADAIRAGIESVAESVVVAGDRHAVKVHAHSPRPDEVVAFGRNHGRVSEVRVEDLDSQAAAHLDLDGHVLQLRPVPTTEAGRAGEASAVRARVVILALVAGDGFEAAFRSFGAETFRIDAARRPGPDELAAAIEAACAREVVLLVNEPEVLAVARGAADAAGHAARATRVRIVPTRNAAEGIAAVIAFDGRRSADENVVAMSATAASITTFRVVNARSGATAFGPDGAVLASASEPVAAAVASLRGFDARFELVTIYHGAGVDRADAEALGRSIVAASPGTEIVVVDGGQPADHYVISAE